MKKRQILLSLALMLIAWLGNAVEPLAEASSGPVSVDTTFNGSELCLNADIPIAYGSVAPYASCQIVIEGTVSHESSVKGVWNWKPTSVGKYDLEWRAGDVIMRSSILVSTRIVEGVVSNGCAIIPEGATDVLDGAFANCDDLKTITIPSSVTNIGANAFNGCKNLERVDVAALEDWLKIRFANDLANPLHYGAALYVDGKELTELVVPVGAMKIGEYAFWGGRFTSVAIPNSVMNIGYAAFAGCSDVKSVIIPKCVTKLSATFPDAYTTIQEVVLANDVTSIGDRAFYGCSGLTEVTVPSSVISIGANAFSGCENLERVDAATLEDWLKIRFANAWANPLCHGAALYVDGKEVTKLEIPTGTVEIGDVAFSGGRFVAVTIPNSVTNIGDFAFYGCENLKRVDAATLEDWLKIRFANDWANPLCHGAALYVDGKELTKLEIPAGTVEIGDYAFWGGQFVAVAIPNSVTNIGYDAFYRCCGVKSVMIPKCVRELFRTFPSAYTTIQEVTLTDNVTSIGDYAFWGCSGLTEVTIPSSVTSIGDCAFCGCENLKHVDVTMFTKGLADIFPDSVAGIERATVGSRDGCIRRQFFAGCASLKTVEVSDTVRRIDAGAFDDCTALETVVFPCGLEDFGLDLIPEAMRGPLGYDDDGFMIKDGWLLDYKEKGASEVVVPEGVIGIGHFALAYMADLERVSLPSTLKYIASAAFVEDTYLDDVVIPDSVEYIGKDAFLRCTWIQSLTFGAGVREIADRAFAGCTKLAEAELPEGLGEVGDAAFSNCWRMVSVSLPLSVSNVVATAFRDCSSLTGVAVPTMIAPMSKWFAPVYRQIENVMVSRGATEVRAEMFAGCVALKAMELPEGVTNLASGAFRDCAAMKAIRLPESLEAVGDEAFAGCAALKSVVLPKKVGVIGKRVFSGCAALSDVRLPRGLTAIPDETFIGCDALALFVVPETVTALGSRIVSSATTAIYYLGNAPAYAADAYALANASLVSYVVEGTRGWDGLPTSRDLPQGWPASNARAITTWAPDQCVIRFHANYGPDATTDQPFTYGAPVTLAKSGFVRAGYSLSGWATSAKGEVVYADGETLEEMPTVPAGVVHLYAVWEDATVEVPVVVPGDGAIFKSETCTVAITCGTEGAAVYYRVGAAPKASSKFLYSAPFEISETSTIYTYALKDGTSSATNVVTITKGHVLTFVEAASAVGITAFALGGDAEWTAEEDANAKVGNASVRSGEIDDDQISWFTAEVEGPGTLSFWWKASCEEDELQDFDHLVFAVDDVVEGEVARLDGITAWERISTTIPAGSHTLYWAYVKDESDFDGEDCGWVDGIVWAPSGSPAVAPTIEGDEGATVTGDAETGFVIKPSEGKTAVEVTIPQGVDAAKVTVEVSVKVVSVKPHGAKVKIISGGADITEFLNVPAADGNGVVDLTKATVKEEIVKEAMDVEKGAEIKLDAANPTLITPNTRVGLFYQLREGTTLEGMSNGDSTIGDGNPWKPEIKVKGGNSAFYSIGVGKGE